MLIAENFRGCLIMAGLDVTPDTPQVNGGDWKYPNPFAPCRSHCMPK